MCYDFDRFIDQDIVKEFICPICTNVLCCPQRGKNTPQSKQELTKEADGHHFCESCITDALKYTKSCPECRRPITNNLQPLNRTLLNLLKNLKLTCKFKSKGCGHVCELEMIESHESTCKYGYKECKQCDTVYEATTDHTEVVCLTIKTNKIIQSKDNENILLKSEIKSLENIINDQNETISTLLKQINDMNKRKSTEIKLNRISSQDLSKISLQIVEYCMTSENNFNRVKMLIQQKADVNYKDVRDCTALIWASRRGHIDIVRLLIENGADVNHKDKDGCDALSGASSWGHLDITKLLIENGAIINTKDEDGETALMKASREGHLNMVKLLITYGANINDVCNSGRTAKKKALLANKHEVAAFLASRGCLD